MGVAGLWDIIRPVGEVRSLTHLAVVDGFQQNPHKRRGLRIGIDASIWFYHATYGKEGENPELRTLFFRCARLLGTPFLPLFVFDGPKRPEVKRGKRINKESQHWMVSGMKNIIHAFGFAAYTAPGEAEAELAYLNSIGEIDAILSDDVDTFLFGATMVIRNPSNSLSGNRGHPVMNSAGKDDGNHAMVYKASSVAAHTDIGINRGGFILIGLLSGGDYHPGGLPKCGPKIALGLARAGLGDRLFEATQRLSPEALPAYLDTWREELRIELRTNASGFIGKKCVALSKSVPDDFPDIVVLRSYTHPITTESEAHRKGTRPKDISWGLEPNISKMAGICELYFEWGVKDIIIKRFRTVIWASVVLRILRQIALSKDSSSADSPITLQSETNNSSQVPLFVKIHSSRTHPFTGNILEYRVEIAPAALVALAAAGVKGTRPPPEHDSAYDLTEQEDDDEVGRGKKAAVDPESHLRIWMPACMVDEACPELVQIFEGKEAEKAAKKAGKGKGREGSAAPASPRKRKPKTFPMPLSQGVGESSDEAPVPALPRRAVSKPPSSKFTLPPAGSQTRRVATLFTEGSSGSRSQSAIPEVEDEGPEQIVTRPVLTALNNVVSSGSRTPTRAFVRTQSSPAALPSPPRPRHVPRPFPGLPLSPIARTRSPQPESEDEHERPVPLPLPKQTVPSYFGARKTGAIAGSSKVSKKAGVIASNTLIKPKSTKTGTLDKRPAPEYMELSDAEDENARPSHVPPKRPSSKAPSRGSPPADHAVQRTVLGNLDNPSLYRDRFMIKPVDDPPPVHTGALFASRRISPVDRHMRSPSTSPSRPTPQEPPCRSLSPPPRPTKPRASGTSTIISISSSEDEAPGVSLLDKIKIRSKQQDNMQKMNRAKQKKIDLWVAGTRTGGNRVGQQKGAGNAHNRLQAAVVDVIDLT